MTNLFAWNVTSQAFEHLPSWMKTQIAKEFENCERSINEKDIRQSYQAIQNGLYGSHAPLAYIRFKDGICKFETPNNCIGLLKNRAGHFCRAVEQLYELKPLPNFTLLLSLDQCFERPYYLHLAKVPVFTIAKSKRNKQTIVFPRGIFEPDRETKITEILQSSKLTPFTERKPAVFWRLKTFERPDIEFDWRLGPTVPLLYLAKNNPELMDFGIPQNYRQFTGNKISGPLSKSIYVTPLKMKEHVNYRYVLAFDQRSSPCDLEWNLFTGSTILRPESRFSEWFTSQLLPYHHYIPLDKRCDNILEAVNWCRENASRAQEIAQNASNFAIEMLSDEKMFAYFYRLLISYIELLKKDDCYD